MRRRRSKQASAPEEVCLPLFLLPFHSHTFLLLLTCALLAWPHHTKEGGCIQELKPAAVTRAKGRGRLIHRRCSRRWLAPWAFAACLAFAWSVHRLTLSSLVRLVQRLALAAESILLQRRHRRRRSSTTTYFFFAFPQSFGPLAWLDRQRLGTTVLTLHYIFVWSWLNLSVFQVLT